LKNKGFSDERRAEIGVYNIDDSATPESNKSLAGMPRKSME
jgi:hypothetical protein